MKRNAQWKPNIVRLVKIAVTFMEPEILLPCSPVAYHKTNINHLKQTDILTPYLFTFQFLISLNSNMFHLAFSIQNFQLNVSLISPFRDA
jgi:hypothetical protein